MKTEEIMQEEDSIRLVEGLLDNDRPLYFLVEDQLLSRMDPVWESLVLGWCAEAGLHLISLDWQDFWKNEHGWLEAILAQMHLLTGHEKK